MSNMHSSRIVKLYQLCIRLATLLIQRKDIDIIFKLKTVTKLENLTGRRWWMTLDLGSLIHQKSKVKKYHKKRKKECLTLRSTYLEERARDITAKGNTREEQIFHELLTMEKVETGPDDSEL